MPDKVVACELGLWKCKGKTTSQLHLKSKNPQVSVYTCRTVAHHIDLRILFGRYKMNWIVMEEEKVKSSQIRSPLLTFHYIKKYYFFYKLK